jgi:hypothetical protein
MSAIIYSLKKGKFSWGLAQLIAFEAIKKALCSTPVWALPDFSKTNCPRM